MAALPKFPNLLKPLDLGFLDYSTLALRKRCCEEELRVNRRYAP